MNIDEPQNKDLAEKFPGKRVGFVDKCREAGSDKRSRRYGSVALDRDETAFRIIYGQDQRLVGKTMMDILNALVDSNTIPALTAFLLAF